MVKIKTWDLYHNFFTPFFILNCSKLERYLPFIPVAVLLAGKAGLTITKGQSYKKFFGIIYATISRVFVSQSLLPETNIYRQDWSLPKWNPARVKVLGSDKRSSLLQYIINYFYKKPYDTDTCVKLIKT